MALFRASQTPFNVAVLQVADSGGASADSEMLGRAFTSLNASIKHYNTRYKWNWLWTESSPQRVYAPFSVTGITASGAAASAAAPAGHGIFVDDFILGSGFMAGVRVTATAASGFGFSAAITGFTGTAVVSASATRDFYDAPSDIRDVYSVRLLGTNRAIYPFQRRAYDRTNNGEFQASSPLGYDLFQLNTKGKIRLLPAPAESDVLQIRYFRAMATASASGVTASLDIPADYDPYLIAHAKWHFLTDKGEGRLDQATVWHTLSKEGLATMLKDQTNVSDEGLVISPGHFGGSYGGDRSTRGIVWDV